MSNKLVKAPVRGFCWKDSHIPDGIPAPWDASGGALPGVVIGTPDRWVISVAGTLPGLGPVQEGDFIVWNGTAWTLIQLPTPTPPSGSNLGSVLDILNTPPGVPGDGDAYLVGTVPVGLRVGHSNQIATWDAGGGVWTFVTPTNGDYVRVTDEATFYGYTGVRNTGAWAIQNIVTFARMLVQGPYATKGFYRYVVSNVGVVNTTYRGTYGSFEAEFGNTGAGADMNVALAQVQTSGALTNFRPGFSGFIKASDDAVGVVNLFSADATPLCTLQPGEKIYIQATNTVGMTAASWDRRYVNNQLIEDAGIIADITNPANRVGGVYVGPLTGLIRDNYYYDGTYHYQYDGSTLYRLTTNSPLDNITDILYADLAAALTGGTATEGMYYRITDYATTHLVYGTSVVSRYKGMVAGMVYPVEIIADNIGDLGTITLTGDSVSDVDTLIAAWNAANPGNTCTLISGPGVQVPDMFETITLINNIHTAAVEPIIVLATSGSTLSEHAWSETHPEDIIEYDRTSSLCEDGATARPGLITYRRDTSLDIDAYFDWRGTTFRSYRLTQGEYDYYRGTPVGCASEVYILATEVGDHSRNADLGFKAIALKGDGISDVDTLVAAWEAAHPDEIVLYFSGGLDLNQAQSIMNYMVGGLAIMDAKVMPDQKTVILETSGQTVGAAYVVNVNPAVGTPDSGNWTGRNMNKIVVAWGGGEVPALDETITLSGGIKYDWEPLATYSAGNIVRDASHYVYICHKAVLPTEIGPATVPASTTPNWTRINRLNVSEFAYPIGASCFGTNLTLSTNTTLNTDYKDCVMFSVIPGTNVHLGVNTKDIVFGSSYDVTIGSGSNSNRIVGNFNKIGDNSSLNLIGNATYVSIGTDSDGNIFGPTASYNTLGNMSKYNVFGGLALWNTLGDNTMSNILGGGTTINNAGKGNILKERCQSIILAPFSSYNFFDSSCGYINFGIGSGPNKFGPVCSSLDFDTGATGNDFKAGISTVNMSSVNHWVSLSLAQVPDGGTFTLTYDDGVNPAITTGAINYNALEDETMSALLAAGLEDSPFTGGLRVSGDFTSLTPMYIEFSGTLAPYMFGNSVQTGFLTIDTTNLTYMGVPIVVTVADSIVGNAPATHVYGAYDCEIYTRPDTTYRLKYMDDGDNQNIVAPTD